MSTKPATEARSFPRLRTTVSPVSRRYECTARDVWAEGGVTALVKFVLQDAAVQVRAYYQGTVFAHLEARPAACTSHGPTWRNATLHVPEGEEREVGVELLRAGLEAISNDLADGDTIERSLHRQAAKALAWVERHQLETTA